MQKVLKTSLAISDLRKMSFSDIVEVYGTVCEPFSFVSEKQQKGKGGEKNY
jgi:hypothetical protein